MVLVGDGNIHYGAWEVVASLAQLRMPHTQLGTAVGLPALTTYLHTCIVWMCGAFAGIHFSEAGDGQIHVVCPNFAARKSMAHTSNEGTGTPPHTATDYGSLTCAKALLELSLSRTRERLGIQGGVCFVSFACGPNSLASSAGCF